MLPFSRDRFARSRTMRPGLRDSAGQSLVEFALASTVFLMTIFGVLELGMAVWRYNMIADLAQEGARWAIVHGSHSTSPASQAAVEAFVQGRANGVAVIVTTTPSSGPAPLNSGATISVTVTGSYTPLTGFIARTAVIPLQSTATMTVAR
jgi:Flp pilus assembly protein TadG